MECDSVGQVHGLFLKMPFMKRETIGWLPMLTLSVERIIADSALLAVFMVV